MTENDATAIALLAHKVDSMNDTLRNLTDAVVRLALIEERQAQASLALERAFKMLEKMEERIAAIEQSDVLQKQTSNWVLSGVWAAAGLAVMFVAKKAGLI